MNKFGKWILFAITAPYGVVVGWSIILLAKIFFFAENLHFGPYGILLAQWKPWFASKWKYSTAFGRGVVFHPKVIGKDNSIYHRIWQHEMIHIKQIESLMMLSCIIGTIVGVITGNYLLGLGIWISGGIWQLSNFMTAVLTGGHIYRDAEHERSAYAQTSTFRNSGKTWLDNHLSKPRRW